MNEVVSKTIKITTPVLPPEVDYIEKEIEKNGLEPLRYAIVALEGHKLTLSVSGREIC